MEQQHARRLAKQRVAELEPPVNVRKGRGRLRGAAGGQDGIGARSEEHNRHQRDVQHQRRRRDIRGRGGRAGAMLAAMLAALAAAALTHGDGREEEE